MAAKLSHQFGQNLIDRQSFHVISQRNRYRTPRVVTMGWPSSSIDTLPLCRGRTNSDLDIRLNPFLTLRRGLTNTPSYWKLSIIFTDFDDL